METEKPLPALSKEEYERLAEQGPPVHDGDYFSLRHPPMKAGKRAKIFAPFAALRGFDAEVLARDEIYSVRPERDAECMQKLDHDLKFLQERIRFHPDIEVRCFQPCDDPDHEAYMRLGRIETVAGPLQEIDLMRQYLRIAGLKISFCDLLEIHFSL